ncbi:MAG: FtsX-like permease family protein [Acidimicrobiales bacterium]|nr:FtsX-like permease family protein [Acidimicrobiales bacterium]
MSILSRKLRRDVWRHKGQFVAVAVTIALGVAVYGGASDAYRNLRRSFDRVYADLHLADVVVTGRGADLLAPDVRALDGRPLVEARLQADVPFRLAGGHKLLGRVVSLPASGQPAVNQVDVRTGAMPGPGEVLVEQHLADHFGLGPGSTLEVMAPEGWRSVRVAGVATSAEYLWPARSRQEILTTPELFGVLFAPEPLTRSVAPQATPQLAVFATDRRAAATIDDDVAALADRAGSFEVTARAEQPSVGALAADVDAVGQFSVLFPLLFLAAASLGTYILLSRLVYAQRSTIGTFLADGIPRRRVVGHFLGYGALAGLAGALPGAVAGVALGGWFASQYTQALGLPLHVVTIDGRTPAVGVLVGVAAALVAAGFPARRAARLSPAEAMRAEAPTGRGGPSLAERLMPPLRRLPARWRMVLRGVGRNRRRAAFTIVGVVIAICLMLVFWGLRDTLSSVLDRQFHETQTEDARLQLAAGAADATLEGVAADPAVAAVERTGQFDAVLTAGDTRYDTLLLAFPPTTTMHRFTEPGGHERTLPDDGVLLGIGLRDTLGVRAGDVVTLTLPGTGRQLQERVAGFVDEPMAAVAYISLDELQRELGDDTATGALLRLVPGADRADAEARISALPGVTGYLDTENLEAAMRDAFRLYDTLVGLMLAFGALMSAALLYNAMAANVAERTAEIGALNAAGMSRRLTARLVAGENLLLTALALPLGLLAGWQLARWFMATYQTQGYHWSLQLRPATPLIAAAAVAVAAALAQLPALRATRHIDIARVVRERST